MFYAPWCGHCKRAKPDYTAAAEALKDAPGMALGALDCTASAGKDFFSKCHPSQKDGKIYQFSLHR